MKKISNKKLTIFAIFIMVIPILILIFMFKKNSNNLDKKIDLTISKLKNDKQYTDIDYNMIKKQILEQKSENLKIDEYKWVLESSESNLNKYNKINNISYSNLMTKLNSKESFYVYFYQPSCSDCEKFEKSGFYSNYEKLTKQNKIKYVSLNAAINKNVWNNTKLWNKEITKTQKSTSKNNGILGTPTIVYFKNGIFNSGITPNSYNDFQFWYDKLK